MKTSHLQLLIDTFANRVVGWTASTTQVGNLSWMHWNRQSMRADKYTQGLAHAGLEPSVGSTGDG